MPSACQGRVTPGYKGEFEPEFILSILPATRICFRGRGGAALDGKHLKPLERGGWIEIWHDRKITAGTEWQGQIDQRLESSGIILLLRRCRGLARARETP